MGIAEDIRKHLSLLLQISGKLDNKTWNWLGASVWRTNLKICTQNETQAAVKCPEYALGVGWVHLSRILEHLWGNPNNFVKELMRGSDDLTAIHVTAHSCSG